MDGRNASDPIENQKLVVGSSCRRSAVGDTPGLSPILPRVYIISETRLFREGLMAMMTREGGIEVVGHGPCTEALQKIRNLAPNVVLLDMAGHDCLVIPRRLHAILPALRIVAIGITQLETRIIACVEAGICGYVAPSGTIEDLVGVLLDRDPDPEKNGRI